MTTWKNVLLKRICTVAGEGSLKTLYTLVKRTFVVRMTKHAKPTRLCHFYHYNHKLK